MKNLAKVIFKILHESDIQKKFTLLLFYDDWSE